MITGSCLCHTVTYQAQKLLGTIVFCHCSYCRKASSSAFSVNSLVNVEDFQILSGADELVTYESSKGKYRYYCKNCHSQIYHVKDDTPDKLTLKLGTIDHCEQDLSQLERKHIHNSQKFPWLE
ncbi:GFA family protein [Streptococcus gallolyticus]|uniref:GFA family protein n=1 Tax=Streptococcus gallolyticus TaxID=315405 RepID=UPI003D6F7266